MVVKQYPHTLEVLKTTAGHENEDGDWVPGTQEWVMVGDCRVEVAKQNAFKTGADGERVYYYATVYGPLPKWTLKFGDTIRVTMGSITEQLTVKMIDNGSQMNNRLWA